MWRRIFELENFWVRVLVCFILFLLVVLVFRSISSDEIVTDREKQIGEMDFSSGVITVPNRLVIDKIGLDTLVVSVGQTRNGNMQVPDSLRKVGWYKYGPKPGEKGNAVIAGHEVNAFNMGAVFDKLDLLKEGDIIKVVSENNDELRFVVTKTAVYKYDEAPLNEIFGPASESNLNLITCQGSFLADLSTKDQRLVVFSTRIP